MAKYKRQKVKRYRRSFYSRGTRIKKGIGIVVLVLAVLGAAWLAAPHVLDWATHTWYTVVKNRDLEAESASRAAASSEAAASSAVQEAASSQPEPEQPKELDGKAITGGSWAAVDVSTLADDAAIRAAAQQLKAQGADYGLVTLKDADGSTYFTFQYEASREMAQRGYFCVDKGSVTVNGVSLTVCEPTDNSFTVAIIPYTRENTNFCDIQVGTVVNLSLIHI